MAYSPYVAPANRPMDITPPAIAGVGGGLTNQVVTSLYDFYKPNEFLEVFERHSYAPSFRMMLKSFGFSRGTAAPTTGHYEYPWRKDLLRVGTIDTASTGAGTNVVVVLAAAGMFDTGVSVSGSGRQASYPIVGDIIITKDGKKAYISAKDTSVTPHKITLTPVKAAVDLAGSVLAANDYFIADNAHAEGSGAPSGRSPRVMKYTNDFQIVKNRVGSTGSELTNQTYFNPVEGVPGSLFLKAELDAYYRFECAAENALLFGSTIDNVTVNVAELGFDVAVKGTEGMIDFVSLNGYTQTYTPASLAMADFNATGRKFKLERVGVNDICTWFGYDLYTETEDLLQSLVSNDVTAELTRNLFRNIGAEEGGPIDDNDFALHIGFFALKKAGYKYYFKSLHAFDEAVGAGATGYEYPQWGIYHPLAYNRDKVTGNKVGTIGYEYKELNGYSRETVIAEVSGAGVAGTGSPYRIASNLNDTHNMVFLSECAFHGACANHMILQTP